MVVAPQPPGWRRGGDLVTADHGEAFGERGALNHAYELWESLVRIALIACVPGVRPHRVATAHSHIDIAPTILEWMGVEPPAGLMQGHSLVDDIRAETPVPTGPERPVLLEIAADSGQDGRRAMVVGGWKLVVRINARGSYHPLLFDLSVDPTEEYDLSDSRPQELALLTAQLEAQFAALPRVTPYGGMRLQGGGRADGTYAPTGGAPAGRAPVQALPSCSSK